MHNLLFCNSITDKRKLVKHVWLLFHSDEKNKNAWQTEKWKEKTTQHKKHLIIIHETGKVNSKEVMRMRETSYVIPGVPGKLALLADFHNRPDSTILPSLHAHAPSLICIAGDVVYGRDPLKTQEHVLAFLWDCASIAPTFLSLGNHEQSLTTREIREIKRTGAVVLDNTWREMDGIVIGGLTSAYVTDRRRGKEDRVPETKWLKKFAAVPGFHILLSHHPEYYSFIPDAVDLILCGHAHGGQIRLFNHGLFAPGQGWFPKYTKGIYDDRMIVSAGLTNTAHGVPRLFNPTEVVFIDGKQKLS